MKVAIVGSRTFNNFDLLSKTVKEYCKQNNISIEIIVSGGAKGADSLAEQFAIKNDLQTKIFYPDWVQFDRTACSVRNSQIVEFSDIVFAFWNGKSPGTNDSITKTKKLQKTIIIVMF